MDYDRLARRRPLVDRCSACSTSVTRFSRSAVSEPIVLQEQVGMRGRSLGEHACGSSSKESPKVSPGEPVSATEEKPSPRDRVGPLFSARSRVEGGSRSPGYHHPCPERPVSRSASSYQRQKWPPAAPEGGWWSWTTFSRAIQPGRSTVYKVAGARRRVQNTVHARSTRRVTHARRDRSAQSDQEEEERGGAVLALCSRPSFRSPRMRIQTEVGTALLDLGCISVLGRSLFGRGFLGWIFVDRVLTKLRSSRIRSLFI